MLLDLSDSSSQKGPSYYELLKEGKFMRFISLILSGLFLLALTSNSVAANSELGMDYLENLTPRKGVAFIKPSEVHSSYQMIIYINTATSGDGRQKMWVLERDNSGEATTSHTGLTANGTVIDDQPRQPWRLALWDKKFWKKKGWTEVEAIPPYSWPVSTGRKYAGDGRSGPTPLGIFNIDDRKYRHKKGWYAPGMIHAMFIDLHYKSGRRSGVAMHGTTSGKYRLLGRADSHGCIRMHQTNALSLFKRVHGEKSKKNLSEANPLWGTMPRYFKNQSSDQKRRTAYVRDGSYLVSEEGELLTKDGLQILMVHFRDD
jgi:hypothetical protein